MSMLFLVMALVIGSTEGQNSTNSTPALNLSGSWRDDRARSWTIAQNGSEVTIADGQGLTIRGTLAGRTIKYTDHIILGETSSPTCHPYVGQQFEFAAELKISKEATRMKRKTPEGVTKGQCRVNIKKIPAFVLTKISDS